MHPLLKRSTEDRLSQSGKANKNKKKERKKPLRLAGWKIPLTFAAPSSGKGDEPRMVRQSLTVG